MPHSQTRDTFRAADASAIRTGLGSQSLADNFECNAVPKGLVAELLPEHRPAGIKHGFSHPRFRQSGRVHVANDYTAMLTHDPRRMFVQEMLPAILNLRVQHRCAPLLASLLRQRQGRFVAPVERRQLTARMIKQIFVGGRIRSEEEQRLIFTTLDPARKAVIRRTERIRFNPESVSIWRRIAEQRGVDLQTLITMAMEPVVEAEKNTDDKV